MPRFFSLAGPKSGVDKVVARMMKQYHGGLEDAGVIVQCLFAHPPTDGDPTGPAILHQGYKALAVVKSLSVKDRLTRGADVEIVIDYDEWDLLTDAQRDALIDHELTHLELVVDDEGNAKRDDQDRPKLRMRKHDRQFGWFDCIARRHGEASQEVRQARSMIEDYEYVQTYLPGFGEEEDEEVLEGEAA